MRRLVLIAVSSLASLGCATSYRDAATVASDVARDEVAATVAMRNAEVGLRGRVEDKGMKTEKAAAARASFLPAPFGRINVELEDKSLGFAVLQGPRSTPGKVFCLFEDWALDDLAAVRVGDTVHVVCEFSGVEGEPPDRVAVFKKCAVTD